ncbi:hypothetical protein DPMN_103432 [Dreissena polymorpha]|uniref:Uncharacterized protein n=1 Tax=Dreissena polymorpha TaxID=45954 RepID=A0A9D4K2M9_DREPO|nr:hypothetical protein DPMN_103432 [Dreissena polymorpha]
MKIVSGHQMGRSAYNINVGYVPMTSSRIAYHPYSNAASMYYKHQSTALSPVSQAHSSIASLTPPLTSHSNHSTGTDQTAFSPVYQGHSSMTSQITSHSNPFSRSHQSAYYPEYSYMSNPSASAASKMFLVDRTGATVYAMQGNEL